MLDQTNYETPVDGLTEINEIVAAGFKVDSTGEATADMKASFCEALHSKFRELPGSPQAIADDIARANDFKRKVPVLAEGQSVLNKNGNPVMAKIGTVEPPKCYRTVVSIMIKVYDTNGQLEQSFTETRKAYREILDSEKTKEGEAKKIVKKLGKDPELMVMDLDILKEVVND